MNKIDLIIREAKIEAIIDILIERGTIHNHQQLMELKNYDGYDPIKLKTKLYLKEKNIF